MAPVMAECESDSQVGLVSQGWKLVYHSTLGYAELFDLRSDSEEAHDLSATQPARLRELGLLLGAEYAQRAPRRGSINGAGGPRARLTRP